MVLCTLLTFLTIVWGLISSTVKLLLDSGQEVVNLKQSWVTCQAEKYGYKRWFPTFLYQPRHHYYWKYVEIPTSLYPLPFPNCLNKKKTQKHRVTIIAMTKCGQTTDSFNTLQKSSFYSTPYSHKYTQVLMVEIWTTIYSRNTNIVSVMSIITQFKTTRGLTPFARILVIKFSALCWGQRLQRLEAFLIFSSEEDFLSVPRPPSAVKTWLSILYFLLWRKRMRGKTNFMILNKFLRSQEMCGTSQFYITISGS